MTEQERQNRIIARGEHSNHSHVVVGDCEITRNDKGEILIEVGEEGAILKHILEKEYVETGKEVWTKEHHDVKLEKGKYEMIGQIEYDPYEEAIRRVQD